MNEEAVKKAAVDWLKKEGYKVVWVSRKRGRPPKKSRRGRMPYAPTVPDIKAVKGTQYYYVEAKGDPKSSNSLYTAIGQLVTKMAAKTPAKYAIALSPSYKDLLYLIPRQVQKRFKIDVLVVESLTETKRLPKTTSIPP